MNYDAIEISIPFYEITPSTSQVLQAMGYPPESDNLQLKDSIEERINEAKLHVSATAGFKIIAPLDFIISKNQFSIAGVEFDSKKIITSQIRKADTIAIFTASLGSAFDQWSKKVQSENILDGYIIDTIGSETVELAADVIEEKINQVVTGEDYFCSSRFSPGYCEWSVAEQHKLFSFLPKNFCGISLTESALMNPIKSVSGIIGIGLNVKKLDYHCRICTQENCYKKKHLV
ncbi:MAG: hypothetical protein KJ799_00185 [Bacteroidetes bacterium]|nr:hypothetical protein [Bacteroidota bacterium]